MGKLLKLEDYRYTWKQVFAHDGEYTTMQTYVDSATNAIEIVQFNDDGEAVRTYLSGTDAVNFALAVSSILRKKDVAE